MRRMPLIAATALGLALASPVLAQSMAPEQYMQQALTAVQAHHRATALIAINNAESALLTSQAAEENRGARDVGRADPSVIRETARAREAVQQRHWKQASDYLKEAMAHPSATGK